MINKNDTFSTFMDKFVFPEINEQLNSDDAFLKALIEVSDYVRGLLYLAANIDPKNNQIYTGEIQAILTGYIAKIFKLYDTFAFLNSENRLEMAWIMTRLLSEASIQLKYLLSSKDLSEISQKFIKSSLVYDKLLFNQVKKDIGNNTPSNIQERMLESIQNEFKDYGFEISDIDIRNDKNWCAHTLILAKEVGLEDMYERVFRTSSRSIHCSWYNLKEFYLIKDHASKSYHPQLNFHAPDPRVIEGTTIIVLKSARAFVDKVTDEDKLLQVFDDCILWFTNMSHHHEKFLASKV